MAKRKNTRMFSRDERRQARGEQLQRAASVTQEDLDRALIARACTAPGTATSPLGLAETYLGICEEQEPEDFELAGALQRQFGRLTGRDLTPDSAAEELDADFEKRDALFEA